MRPPACPPPCLPRPAAPAPLQGAAAILLTNKPSLQRRAKYTLDRRYRVNNAAREEAYRWGGGRRREAEEEEGLGLPRAGLGKP